MGYALYRRGMSDFYGYRIMQHFLYQTPDIFRHGSRKEQCLMRLGQTSHDIADIRQKAHIEHPVGLIDDQDFYPG